MSAITTEEAFEAISPLDIELVVIAETFGDDDLDQVITAIALGADPNTAINDFNAARDAEDEQYDFAATVAALPSRAGAEPELLRSAA